MASRQGTVKVHVSRAASLVFSSPPKKQARFFCTVTLDHRLGVGDIAKLRQTTGLSDDQIGKLLVRVRKSKKAHVGGACLQPTELRGAKPGKAGHYIEFYADFDVPIWGGWDRGVITVVLKKRVEGGTKKSSGGDCFHLVCWPQPNPT